MTNGKLQTQQKKRLHPARNPYCLFSKKNRNITILLKLVLCFHYTGQLKITLPPSKYQTGYASYVFGAHTETMCSGILEFVETITLLVLFGQNSEATDASAL